jgi:hypothetical protein
MARRFGLGTAEVRKANNGADQQEENDKLEVFNQKDSHRSPTLLFLRKPCPASVTRNVGAAA